MRIAIAIPTPAQTMPIRADLSEDIFFQTQDEEQGSER